VHVVDKAVAVVVGAVAGGLTGIGPGNRAEAGRVEAVARVDVGDDDGGRSGRAVPGERGAYVRSGNGAGEAAAPAAAVAESPKLGKGGRGEKQQPE
jgi:hypothetical protein